MGTNIAKAFGHKTTTFVSDPKLPIPDAKVGIEVECENNPGFAGYPMYWEGKRDDSLRNAGIEFVTVGGLQGTQIRDAVHGLCDFIAKTKMTDGYPRAGIHIHVDCTDLNGDNPLDLWHLAQVNLLCEDALFRFAEGARVNSRRACGYCDPLVDSQADFVYLAELMIKWNSLSPARMKALLSACSKYQATNFMPLMKLGTVEFRHLPTTFDAQRIMTWIEIILSMKRAATTVMRAKGFDLCREFSGRGPRDTLRLLLGAEARHLEPFVDEPSMWRAIDALQGFRSFAEELAEVPTLDWDQADNELVLSKAGAKPKQEAKVEINVDALNMADINPNVREWWMQDIRQRNQRIEELANRLNNPRNHPR